MTEKEIQTVIIKRSAEIAKVIAKDKTCEMHKQRDGSLKIFEVTKRIVK